MYFVPSVSLLIGGLFEVSFPFGLSSFSSFLLGVLLLLVRKNFGISFFIRVFRG